MARVMAPEVDWRWLRDVVNRLHGAATPARPIAPHLVPLRRRIKAGYALMRKAETNELLLPMLRAGRFRDGLMLVLQSQRALRLANLTMIRIGKHLIRMSDGYWLQFEAAEMKARRPFETPAPAELTETIDRYLGHWRPLLLRGGTTDALWLTQAGRAMQSYSVASRMTKLTRRLFDKTMSTHKFRHGLASHIADEMPDQVLMAVPMLGHKQFATTNRYIVKAHSLKASRRQNVHLKELRRELAEQLRNDPDLRASGHGRMKRSRAKRT
jgi:integrase